MPAENFPNTSSTLADHTDRLKPDDNLAAAYGNLIMAAMMIRAELALVGDSDALTDCACLIADAMSQIRGERQSRLPEYPILEGRS